MIEYLKYPIDKYPYFLFFNCKTISRASLFNWIIDFKMILPCQRVWLFYISFQVKYWISVLMYIELSYHRIREVKVEYEILFLKIDIYRFSSPFFPSFLLCFPSCSSPIFIILIDRFLPFHGTGSSRLTVFHEAIGLRRSSREHTATRPRRL